MILHIESKFVATEQSKQLINNCSTGSAVAVEAMIIRLKDSSTYLQVSDHLVYWMQTRIPFPVIPSLCVFLCLLI